MNALVGEEISFQFLTQNATGVVAQIAGHIAFDIAYLVARTNGQDMVGQIGFYAHRVFRGTLGIWLLVDVYNLPWLSGLHLIKICDIVVILI